MKKEIYTVDDCGLFIGLVTEPIGEKDFYEKEFENGIFPEYLSKLNTKKLSSTIKDPTLYNPNAYHIFGEYDLAILSLVDDLNFGLRVFHPSHGYFSKTKKENSTYNHQNICGLTTYKNENFTLKKLAKRTFLKGNQTKRYPFIGITKIKLNNGLLIGNGVDFIEKIKDKLNDIKNSIKEEKGKDLKKVTPEIEIINIDSFCSNEITTVCFANGFSVIGDYIFQIRKLKLSDININNVFINNSLLLNAKLCSSAEVLSSHLIAETYSVLGYDYNYKKKDFNFLKEYDDGVKIRFQCNWNIRPGHLNDFFEIDLLRNIGINRKDCIYPAGVNTVVTQHNFDQVLNIHGKVLSKNNYKHIKQIKTTIFTTDGRINDQEVKNEHPGLTEYLKNFIFTRDEIYEIRKALNECNVAKVNRERILKMYNNFNNCISDPVFFVSFIELKGFLNGIKNEILKNWKETFLKAEINDSNKLDEFHAWLNITIKYFERAYNNRFHQSNKLRELPDTSLEFNGGIQQLISVFDAVYKAVLNPLGSNYCYTDFVHISGYERVHSVKHALRLNILHIINPELFVTTVYKEGTNFYIDRIIPKDKTVESGNKNVVDEINMLNNFDDFINNGALFYTNIIFKIQQSTEYDKNKYKEILDYLDNELIFDIYTDIVALSVGYMEYLDILIYWYSLYFIQMTDCYTVNKDGRKLKTNSSVRFIIRLFILLVYYEKTKSPEYELALKEILKINQKILPVNDFEVIYNFTRMLFDVLNQKNIYKENSFFSTSSKLAESACKRQVLIEFDEHKKNTEITRKARASHQDKYLFYRRQEYDNLQEEIKLSIKEGTAITNFYIKDENNNITDQKYSSGYIQRFLLAYLDFLKTELESKKHDTYSKNKPEIDDIELLCDPQGGLLIHNPSKRKDFFKYRAVFYKTVLDYSTKIKLAYMLKYK
jgi:hypothetical protein